MEINQIPERIKFAPKTFIIPAHKTVSTKVIKTKKYLDIASNYFYNGGKERHQISIFVCIPKSRNCQFMKTLITRENEEHVSYTDLYALSPSSSAAYFGGILPPEIMFKIENDSNEPVKIKLDVFGIYATIIK